MESNSKSEAIEASNGNGTASATIDPCASSLLPSPTTNSNSIPAPTIASTNPTNSSTPSKQHNILLHAHRQSHNSSKLPAFRFADRKKESIQLPSLLQSHHIPPSPVSPDPEQYTEAQSAQPVQPVQPAQPNAVQDSTPPVAHNHRNTGHTIGNDTDSVSPKQLPKDVSSPLRSPRSRASTFQSPTALLTATSTSSHNVKRSASLDSTATAAATTAATANNKLTSSAISGKSPTDSAVTIITARRPRHKRALVVGGSINGTASSQRMHATDDSQTAISGEEISKGPAHGQRELLLPKTIQKTAATDERRSSMVRRPPVSYKPPASSNNSGGTTSIPPIRSFRSSGERRSLVLDMNVRNARPYDGGDDYGDSNHRDRTLRALEGRRYEDASQITPPDSAGDRPDGDDSGDLFLKIAREDSLRRGANRNGNYGDNQSALSRVSRSSRRPLSMGVSSYQPSSPPQMTRRLSDQESSRSRGPSDDQSGERIARTLTYRGAVRDRSSEEAKPKSTSTPFRASPLTPRSLTFQDAPSEQGSAYNRRKGSVDNGSGAPSRISSLKQSNVNYSHPRTYSSSPLVPKPAESQKHDSHADDVNHGVEGTNSTTSTAAPSTVWDELDDLKSRIHRLELTGKLPPTSGAAMSRAYEERPPTAHTNATTLSASPKRGSGNAVQPPETNTTQREAHPLLHSALTKSKDFLSREVFEALETAANDALALSLMMGMPGQPGPIASGASSIGSGTTVTDRQLRRKADSICRSLTELCLALSEGVARGKAQQVTTQQVTVPAPENPPASPTITKFSGMAAERRPSVADRTITVNMSPRALSRYEDRRSNTSSSLAGSSLAAPRYNTTYSSTAPPTPTDTTAAIAAGRKTALLISRSRRAGTEEPEEGRKSSLLRTRRATTEEPEDFSDRKPPVVVRGRRGTLNNRDDEGRFLPPPRAITEVQGSRSGTGREYSSQLPAAPSREQEALASSALPRRRFGSSALNTKLVIPATTSTSLTTPSRRYFDRTTPDREIYNVAERIVEERPPPRQYAIARARHGSIDKRTNRTGLVASSPVSSNYR